MLEGKTRLLERVAVDELGGAHLISVRVRVLNSALRLLLLLLLVQHVAFRVDQDVVDVDVALGVCESRITALVIHRGLVQHYFARLIALLVQITRIGHLLLDIAGPDASASGVHWAARWHRPCELVVDSTVAIGRYFELLLR